MLYFMHKILENKLYWEKEIRVFKDMQKHWILIKKK